jgi:hypothetical protein
VVLKYGKYDGLGRWNMVLMFPTRYFALDELELFSIFHFGSLSYARVSVFDETMFQRFLIGSSLTCLAVFTFGHCSGRYSGLDIFLRLLGELFLGEKLRDNVHLCSGNV